MTRERGEFCYGAGEETGRLAVETVPQLSLHHVGYTPQRLMRQQVVVDEDQGEVGAGDRRCRRLPVGVLRRFTATNERPKGPLYFLRPRHPTLATPNEGALLWFPFGLVDSK